MAIFFFSLMHLRSYNARCGKVPLGEERRKIHRKIIFFALCVRLSLSFFVFDFRRVAPAESGRCWFLTDSLSPPHFSFFQFVVSDTERA